MFSGHSILGLPPLVPLDVKILSQGRVTISFLVLAFLLLLTRGAKSFAMNRSDALRCMALGVLGVAGANFFYYYAISVTSVSIAIIVQYTAPVWVLLYMVFRGHERATLPRIVGVGAAIAGIVLVIGIRESGLQLAWKGVGASLLAAFSFSFYTVYVHHSDCSHVFGGTFEMVADSGNRPGASGNGGGASTAGKFGGGGKIDRCGLSLYSKNLFQNLPLGLRQLRGTKHGKKK